MATSAEKPMAIDTRGRDAETKKPTEDRSVARSPAIQQPLWTLSRNKWPWRARRRSYKRPEVPAFRG
jgi:hypothetical protein